MPNQVTISTLNGSPNFNVYVCDLNITNCVYISTITLGQIPYSFNVPFPYNILSSVYVKIVDDDGCVINQLVNF